MTQDTGVPPAGSGSREPSPTVSAVPASIPNAEEVARLFHEAYEELAPQFNYDTRKDSACPWSEVPYRNKQLMIATAGRVLAAIARARGEA